MNTTNVENNPGPAAITLIGNKNLEIACSIIMGESDVQKNPLNITEAKEHTCYYDSEKNIALRKYNGAVRNADFAIMSEERNTRKKQGRDISEIEEIAKETQGMEI